jgi:hypothetical protein
MRIGEFVILYDTREKEPWRFMHPCLRATLDTGDYTIQGFERSLRIERKGTAGELAGNCGGGWKRFSQVVKRLSAFKHKCIICDFALYDVYKEEWHGAVTADIVIGRVSEIMLEYGVPVLFAGKRGRRTAELILLRYYNRNR